MDNFEQQASELEQGVRELAAKRGYVGPAKPGKFFYVDPDGDMWYMDDKGYELGRYHDSPVSLSILRATYGNRHAGFIPWQ